MIWPCDKKKMTKFIFYPHQNKIITLHHVQGCIEEVDNDVHRHNLLPTIESF